MLLVDTSVWVELFRRRPQFDVRSTLDLDDVVTCPPVIQEVLQGFRDERAFRLARSAMLALPVVDAPLPLARFEEAAQLYRTARRAGLTVRSSIDCLIAASALRHELTVLHVDRDFPQLATVSSLAERRL